MVGQVEGKNVIMIDDIADTAGTLANTAAVMKEKGALSIYACCTHAVLSGPAIERIENSCIDEMIILNTICTDRVKNNPKFKILSVADIFAQAIESIYENMPISRIYTQKY